MATPRLDDIAAFMKARHDMYLAKKAGKPKPWTTDPVLRTRRLHNIFHELDPMTIWIREHVREPYANHPRLWFMIAMARYIGYPETIKKLIHLSETGSVACWPSHPDFNLGEKYISTKPAGFDASSLTWALRQCEKSQKKVYAKSPDNRWAGWSVHKYVSEVVLGRLWEDRSRWELMLESPGRALRKCWQHLQSPRYEGWSPFLAYQFVTDLRHTRYLKNAPDKYSWVFAGRGAIRGLDRLYGRPFDTKHTQISVNDEIIGLMRELNRYDDPGFLETFGVPNGNSVTFEMRDIEQALCEFDKYER